MSIELRTGTTEDAASIHALIAANLSSGHLLPRSLEDVEERAERFVVGVDLAGRDRAMIHSAASPTPICPTPARACAAWVRRCTGRADAPAGSPSTASLLFDQAGRGSPGY